MIHYDGLARSNAAVETIIDPLGYGYLNTGNLGSITGADASLTYTYDGSFLMSQTWSGAIAGDVAWTYDANLDLATETVKGSTVAFGYDGDGLLTDAGAIHLSRNGAGVTDATTLGAATDQVSLNEFAETMEYSAAHAGATVLSFQYNRDTVGRITGITEHAPDGDTHVGYTYDAAGRLQDAFYPAVNIHYDYDANGNRIARHLITSGGTVTETASYDAQDRLINYEGTLYTYTANGELRTKSDNSGTTTYDYDALGNLRHVTLSNGTRIDYLVDGQNRRVGKKVNGVLVNAWLYSGQLRIIAELDGEGRLVSRFVYGTRSNVPDYMIRDGITYRILSDHLGSPRVIFNVSNGAVVATMRYDEFGNVGSEPNAGFVPFGFAGGLYDHLTGLTRFGARDYDPRVGRWTTTDPLRFHGGDSNLYRYVIGDPVNRSDSYGLDALTDNPQVRQIFWDLWQSSLAVGTQGGEMSEWLLAYSIPFHPNSVLSCTRWPYSNQYRHSQWPKNKPWPRNYIAQAHTHPTEAGADPTPSHDTPNNDGDDVAASQIHAPVYTISRKGIWKIDPSGNITQEAGPEWTQGLSKKGSCGCVK
jgi:RHS repeat-associated protein